MNAKNGLLLSAFMSLWAVNIEAAEYINPTFGIPVSEMTEEQKQDVRQQYRERMAAKKAEAHQLRVARAQRKATDRRAIIPANQAAVRQNQAVMRDQFARFALPYSYVPRAPYRVANRRYRDWGYRRNVYVRPYYLSRPRY